MRSRTVLPSVNCILAICFVLFSVPIARAQAPSITGLSPTAGGVGAVVTVSGSNFGSTQGSSTVTFNGTQAATSFWHDFSIGVSVPSGATSGNVVVTVGGVASNGVAFTVSPITFVQGNSGTTSSQVATLTVRYTAAQTEGNLNVVAVGFISPAQIQSVTDTKGNIYSLAVGPTTEPAANQGQAIYYAKNIAAAANANSVTVTFSANTFPDIRIAEYRGLDTSNPLDVSVARIGELGAPSSGSATTTSAPDLLVGAAMAALQLGSVGSGYTGRLGSAADLLEDEVVTTTGSYSATETASCTKENVCPYVMQMVAFKQASPQITNDSPQFGPAGTVVTVTGSHFGATQGSSTISFGSTPAKPTSWSDTQIVVPVPSAAPTGRQDISVVVNGLRGGAFFQVGIPPLVSTVAPQFGPAGTVVTITGMNFGATQGSSTVQFGTTLATPTSWSSTQIVVPVPSGAPIGREDITVTVNKLVGGGFFQVGIPPLISTTSPQFGPVGTVVTITGTNFGATQGSSTVQFGTTLATPTSWSNTQIVVPVPSGTPIGREDITVTVNKLVGGAFFQVGTPPMLTTVSPQFGPVGTVVTITGTNFGATQGSSTLQFGTTKATPTSWSNTQIVVAVPNGTPTGREDIDVIVNGLSGAAFFQVGIPPSVSSVSPQFGPVGTVVTITGTNFGATQGSSTVQFGAAQGIPTSWSNTQIVVPVPSGLPPGNEAITVTVNGLASTGMVVFNVTATPTIASLSPAVGPVGTRVTISGTNFGATQGTSTVTFNGVAGTPTSWSNTQVVVPVPGSATTGKVVVTVGGIPSNGSPFTVAPAISSLSPTAGSVGIAVTISGTDFGATQGTSTVTFGGVASTPTSWSNTQVVAPVPTGAITGNVVVTVGGVTSNGSPFTVGLAINGLSPSAAPAGASVTITGANFGATQGTSTVKFNGTTGTPTSWSNSQIVVPVPTGATSGNVVVTVGSLVSNGVALTVLPTPVITSLSLSSGPVGACVTITGTNFGASQGTSTITFNGVAATPSSWSATSIVACVPAGATTGNIVVTVSGVASNGVTFTVTGTPAIASLSPSSGPVGAAVTIIGTNFGATQGTSQVTFNGVTATPSSWSATSITAPVPTGGTTGNVVVTVSGVASNGMLFTVTGAPSITAITPNAAFLGASVTISGTNFGAVQGASTVSFNGTLATPTSWSATSMVVSVPAGATTGNVVVTVSGVASNGVLFTVNPTITGLNPAAGPVGSSVNIVGASFRATQGNSTVTLNGTLATATSWSATNLMVTVPTGATSGNFVVTVGGAASNGFPFTVVTTPSITSISPRSAAVGTAVTISGANFGPTQGSSTVTFNGTLATPTSWSATSITVPVPTGATSGNVIVTVGGVASNPLPFVVGSGPIILGLSPISGVVGTSVTISGLNFGTSATTSVTFNGTSAAPTSVSANSIVVPVPAGATTGPVVVTVNGVPSNPVIFVVGAGPGIIGLSPSAGPPATQVVINGANFGNTQGTSTVTFNGTPASPSLTSWSANTITTPVPLGATTGNVVVTVGGVASNGVVFTVTPQINTISQSEGPVGMGIVICGTNFGTMQNTTVKLGATPMPLVRVGGTECLVGQTTLVVTVPTVALGNYSITVNVSGFVSGGAAFKVDPPFCDPANGCPF